MAATAIKFFQLNTGAKIPSVGLGTWQAEPGVVAKAVTTAIQVGYRHIDCAQAYSNQAEIGSALKKLFEDGVVKREELWITSKLWCSDHDPEDVPKALDKTLTDLQLDYLDLYLIHWPVRTKKGSVGFKPENLDQPDIPSTWRAMEALYDSGKAKAIGVSNFSSKKLQDLLDIARVPPAVNQVELNPGWQNPKLHAFCESKGVHLSGYSPLGSPGVFNNSDILKNPVVKGVAEKLGKTPAQVALRWGLQIGHSVLPKSTTEARIKENFDVFDWSIPEDLIAKFSEIKQDRLIKGTFAVNETYGAYKTLEDLWDGELDEKGAKIPSVGLGTYQVEPCAIAKTITTAIKVGYRHIDCASLYTNQAEIGSALKKLFEDGVVKREDLWITSKLWCTDHDPKDVPKALDKTLKDLQLDYLDLYLIHWPVSMKKGSSAFQPENLVQPEIPNTWRAMEALYDSGKARAIGVSNFSSKKLQDLLDIARVPPAVNQVELNPGWQQPKLHALCESKGVHLSGYSPLGSPRLSSNNILKSQVVKRVAEKLGKTPAQVALRWGLQVGHSVLTKSINETRIKENFDVFDWSIPEDMIAMFSEIKQDRLIKGTFAVNETYGVYKTIEDLWDDEV